MELAETRSIDPEVLELIRQKSELVRSAPRDARAHGTLGLVYSANGLWDVAARSLANAALLEPDDQLWAFYQALALRETGDGGAASALLARVARERTDLPAVQQRLGHWLLDAGDLAGARAAFTRALAGAPDSPELLVGMAGVELALEQWQAAFDLAQRALAKDPSYTPAHYASGQALRGLGRDAEAARELTIGVGAQGRWLDDPLSAEVRTYRVNYVARFADASRLMLAGSYARALPVLERIHAKRPDDVAVLSNLAACYQETGQPARAVELLQRALELDERSFSIHLNLADAYLRLGRPEDAERHADRACALSPELGRAHLTRARVLALRGAFEPAYAALRESVRLDPNNTQVYVALTEVCMRVQRVDEAFAWGSRAVELDPAHLPSRVNLAHICILKRDFAAARRHVDELLRVAPKNERVRALAAELEKSGR